MIDRKRRINLMGKLALYYQCENTPSDVKRTISKELLSNSSIILQKSILALQPQTPAGQQIKNEMMSIYEEEYDNE